MLKLIEVSKIDNGTNIRNEKDNEILELADSIERNGLINPILVRETGKGKYVVIAGHRRFEAVKKLGLPHIECNIAEEMDNRELLAVQIAENVHRKNMSAFELVKVFEDMKKRFKMNQKQIAAAFGKSDVWVCNQYQVVNMVEKEYGKEPVPEDVKKKTAGQIKNDIKKKMNGDYELIFCNGMKVKVVGHTYTCFCGNNEAENALRKFIDAHRIGGSNGKH